MGYIALNITHTSRERLLKKFKPLNDKVIAHHITYQFPAKQSDPLPSVKEVKVVGYTSTEGLECAVVEVDGDTKRPDGGTFHITLSLEPSKHKPVDSNELIRKRGWVRIVPQLDIDAVAAYNA